jgi:epsilon-lactone hydrolase
MKERKMPSPEHEAVIKALQEKPLDVELSFVEQRAYYEAMVGGVPLPVDVTLEEVVIAGREADLLLTRGADARRVVMHLHGGGYVIGSNRMYRDFGSRLSRATRTAVLVPHYRLAPEDPFPGAVEDAVHAYRWLLDRGFAPSAIAISGDSAGGGLAVATIMKLRDTGLPLPGAGIFISPWTDLELTGSSFAPGAVDDPIMDPKNLANLARQYAGDNLRDPLVSPVHGNVSNFPPALVFAGTREYLLDDARRLCAALKAAHVSVRYIEGEGLIHCWAVLVPNAPESAECLRSIGQFLDEHRVK